MYSNNPCYTLYGYERFSFKYLVDCHINEMGIYVLYVYVQKLAHLILHYYITDWMFHCLGVFDSFQRMFCDIWVDFMRLYNNLLWYSYLEIFLLILTWATSPIHINTPVSFSNWMLSVLCKVEGLQPTLYMYHCTTSLPLVFDIRLLTVNLFLQAQHYKSSVKDFS